jgi:hypothetical protein
MGRHTDTGFQPTPAIVRPATDADLPLTLRLDDEGKILGEPKDTVTHSRGFGDSGYRVQVVNHDCPHCDFDRMVRRVDVSPDLPDELRYWCLNPNCPYFVRDTLSYAMHGNYPQRDVGEPVVFEERTYE